MTTRESWLEDAITKLRPLFTKQNLIIPPVVKVSCGFPSKNPIKVLGECHLESTFDGSVQIFISPIHKDGKSSLGTLVHELLHACLPITAKHGPEFKDGMKLIGLEGKARYAGPNPELELLLEKMADELGDYPNPTIRLRERTRKETANTKKSFKLFCPKARLCDKNCMILDKTNGADYTVNASRKSLKLGLPQCPCSVELEFETEDFELYKLGSEQ